METHAVAHRHDEAIAFLEAHSAARIEHPGGTLLDHLGRTQGLLQEWGARDRLILAGLCHATYGTDGFTQALLDRSHRGELAEAIGGDAEEIVYFYASCDRRFLFPKLAGQHQASFRDRFTGQVFIPEPNRLREFMELTFANELDVARHSRTFAENDWPQVAPVFARCRKLITPAAWTAFVDFRP